IRFTERPRPYSPCSVFTERRRRGRRAGVGENCHPTRWSLPGRDEIGWQFFFLLSRPYRLT
uniref:Uncharacterized protein n=1 Tax=Triticum urartu TaxID=4572 RepID=A0A8R7UX50_TRIUA